MRGQDSLDLGGLNPEPPHLHLIIRPPREHQLTIAAPEPPIPRPVHPLPRTAPRARHEPGRRQPRPVRIAARHSRSGDIDLAAHAGRDQAQTVIQHPYPAVHHRTARGRQTISGRPVAHRRCDRYLGRAVGIHQGRPGHHNSASSAGHASPPTTGMRSPGTPSGDTPASAAGGISACDTPPSEMTRSRTSLASTAPGGGTTSAAPAVQAVISSSTDASKLGDANSSTRDRSDTASRSASVTPSDTSPAAGTTTPFGTPDDPDVNTT